MNNKLNELRNTIDTIDKQLLELLHKRIEIMKQIGTEKKQLQLPIRDQHREKEKLSSMQKQAKTLDLPLPLITNIWKIFFEISEEIEK